MDWDKDWAKEPWVYGVVERSWVDEPVFVALPRQVCDQQSRWLEMLDFDTWGAVRRMATDEEYAELLERAGFGSFEGYAQHIEIGRPIPGVEAQARAAYEERQGRELPNDADEFDPGRQISGFGDGDFPPHPEFLMFQLIPEGISRKHGNVYETIFNGTFVRFRPEAEEPVIDELERRGYDLTKDIGLVSAVMMPIG